MLVCGLAVSLPNGPWQVHFFTQNRFYLKWVKMVLRIGFFTQNVPLNRRRVNPGTKWVKGGAKAYPIFGI
jgi:hypothetical protein